MVYGVTLISKALEKNTNVTGLNLFKNTFDVDGCRALRELLKVNKNLFSVERITLMMLEKCILFILYNSRPKKIH